MSLVTVDTDGILRCYHGEQARLFTSTTDKNPGRYVPAHPRPNCIRPLDSQFYSCPKRPKSAQCGFFCQFSCISIAASLLIPHSSLGR